MKNPIVNPHDGSIIEPSNTWLYFKMIKVIINPAPGENNSQVIWKPYRLNQVEYLQTLKLGLLGDPRCRDTTIWRRTYIRFGWFDKELNSLEWISLDDIFQAYIDKTITKTNRAKLNHICRLLFISIKDISV